MKLEIKDFENLKERIEVANLTEERMTAIATDVTLYGYDVRVSKYCEIVKMLVRSLNTFVNSYSETNYYDERYINALTFTLDYIDKCLTQYTSKLDECTFIAPSGMIQRGYGDCLYTFEFVLMSAQKINYNPSPEYESFDVIVISQDTNYIQKVFYNVKTETKDRAIARLRKKLGGFYHIEKL